MDSNDFVSVEGRWGDPYSVTIWSVEGVPVTVASSFSKPEANALRDSIAQAFESWVQELSAP